MVSPEETPPGRPAPSKAAKRPAASSANSDAQVVVTLKVSDGSILKVEAVDSGGARHDLTAADAATFLGDRSTGTVAGLVHQAFEAGIACILDELNGESGADDASDENGDDALLHEELLGALIEQSPARRLLRREVLNGALLGTIFSEASGAAPAQ
jgi:hypothetical protein